jgi:(E)-4-hydroxy-3-methylbut-2-enyl-diphosphate synthase
LVADVHFLPEIALEALEIVEKVRINPGNFGSSQKSLRERALPFFKRAKELGRSVRIGANHGSLSEHMVYRYGNTSVGMVESAREFLEIADEVGFSDSVVSFKSSDVHTMVETYRLAAETLGDVPLHLGVTEAGFGDEARIKSAIGIGSLLLDGMGDTIRVSLTEHPVQEIIAAQQILQSLRLRLSHMGLISCPGCGRTQFDLEGLARAVKERFGHLKGVTIAVMGCIVNGPGEMGQADFGYIGAGKGKVHLFRAKECVKKNIPEGEALDELESLISGR